MYLSCISSALMITPCLANDDNKKWQFEIAVGMEREPTYTGSDKYVTEPLLGLEAKYQLAEDKSLWISIGEIGVEWQVNPSLEVMASLEYEPGRENGDDPILTGFPKVKDTVEGQFTIKRNWGNTYAGAVFQPDLLGRGKGLVGFVAAGNKFELTPKLSLDASVDVSFADAEHMNTEIGVSSAVSQATGIDAYEASSGYKSTTLKLDLEYEMNPRWSLISTVGYEYYGKEMSSSPLIDQFGENGNLELTAGIQYRF